MFEVTKENSRYSVRFTGNKNEFGDFITAVYSLPYEDRDIEPRERRYLFTEKGYRRLLYKFSDFMPTLDELLPLDKTKATLKESIPNVCEDFKLELFGYQKKAVNMALKATSALIQLPCGSGKTPIGIGIFSELYKDGKLEGPGLIICKASQKNQWPPEIKKFTHYKDVSIIKTYAESGNKKQNFEEQFKDNLLYVCNYETLNDKRVRTMLRELKISFIYADEIHYIKSPTAKRTKSLWEFSDVSYRFGSTATVISKNPEDIFSIYKFVKPDLFGTISKFRSNYVVYNGYGRVSRGKNTNHLKNLINPYFITIPDEEVNSELPSQVVIPRYATFTSSQMEMNAKIMEELDDFKKQEERLLARLGQKESKGHPELEKIGGNIMARQTFAQFLADDERLLQMSDSEMANNYITGSKSDKLETFMGLIEEIIEAGEKVAVFTRYERMQRILEEEINKAHKKVKVAKVNGKMNGKKRHEAVYENFNKKDDCKVLLLTDAGCEGLNLSYCKYLIEYEPAESYKTQTQRRGRNQRSDSIHDTVYVYQLITENSWDEIAIKIVDKKESYHIELTS